MTTLCKSDMGEEDRGGLPDLDPKSRSGFFNLPNPDPDLSKKWGGLPDLDPTRPDFCRDIIPLEISCPWLMQIFSPYH